VGRPAFDKFIPHYFAKWSGKSLDSFEFRGTFLDYFNGLGDESIKQKIATIDWQGRLYTPGLPPKPDFDTSMVAACYELASKWRDSVREMTAINDSAVQALTNSSHLNLPPRTSSPSRPTKRLPFSTRFKNPGLCPPSAPSFSARHTT